MPTTMDAEELIKLWITFLNHDVAITLLPAMYFRIKLAATGEHRVLTYLAAALVGALTFVLFSEGRGTWNALLAVVTAQASSFAIFAPGWRWKFLGLQLAAMVAVLAMGDRDDLIRYMILALIASAVGAAAMLTPRHGMSAVGLVVAAAAISSSPTGMSTAYAAGASLLPLDEFAIAHATVRRFMDPAHVEAQLATLAVTTLHCQLAVGYLGVGYVRAAQSRKNLLLLTGGGPDGAAPKLPAAEFTRAGLRFIAVTAIPYLLQRTVFESINQQVSSGDRTEIERRSNPKPGRTLVIRIARC